MAIHFTCPQCQKSIKVADELAGSSGQCPGCMAAFTVPGQVATVAGSKAAASLELTGELLEPAWHTVRRGLSTVYAATTCWIIMACLGPFFIFSRSLLPSWTFIFFVVVLGPLSLLALVLLLIGLCKCCRTPVSSGARGFAIACVSCLILLNLGVAFLEAYPELKGESPGPVALVRAGNAVLAALAMVFSVLFVSRIGRFFENRQLERTAKRLILFGLLSIPLWFGLIVLLTKLLPGRWFFLGMGITGVAALIMLIWYRRLIRRARDSIRAAQAASLASD